MAWARVSCASRERAPCDMAPVENRRTMSVAGSTSSIGMGLAAGISSSRSCSSSSGRSLASLANVS